MRSMRHFNMRSDGLYFREEEGKKTFRGRNGGRFQSPACVTDRRPAPHMSSGLRLLTNAAASTSPNSSQSPPTINHAPQFRN